jgi:hypothetical protein
MSRFPFFASALLLAATFLQAAPVPPAPDFWYVVSGESDPTVSHEAVRGLVLPTSVGPTVQTGPEGSVVSWLRPDGTTHSVVVKGLSSLALEPGPLKGTTYVPFRLARTLQYNPDACCTCASWRNSVESFERLSCVPGCDGCGCEACICSPSSPCPQGLAQATTLVANNDPTARLTFDTGRAARGLTMSHGRASTEFRGRGLDVELNTAGQIDIVKPESIALPGAVVRRNSVEGDMSFYAWSSPDTTVLLEQPRSFGAPSFRDGMLDFAPPQSIAPRAATSSIRMDHVADRCRVCGTHPNSDGDVDRMECIPGSGTCYRCISWECFAAER